MNSRLANASGTSRAISIGVPFARADTSLAVVAHEPDSLKARAMLALDEQQQSARDWFESLRDRICREFEAIEREAGSDAAFRSRHGTAPIRTASREAAVRGQMNGRVFEKVE